MISCPGLGKSSKLVMGGYCNLQAACGCVCGQMPGCVLEANSCWLPYLPQQLSPAELKTNMQHLAEVLGRHGTGRN